MKVASDLGPAPPGGWERERVAKQLEKVTKGKDSHQKNLKLPFS